MMRRLFAGNWKMHKTQSEAQELSVKLRDTFRNFNSAEIMVAPPFTSLAVVAGVLNSSVIRLGAQNCHWEDMGAFTGEISPVMLKEIGVRFVILGHSERRQYFSETDSGVNRRARAAMKREIVPVICVGETRSQREKGETLRVVEGQLRGCLENIKINSPEELVIAYEPVWAIGTGITAEPGQIEEVHIFIRKVLKGLLGDTAQGVRILYGGSVKPDNIRSFINRESVDGALVGGASLDAKDFFDIASCVNN